MVQAYGLIGEVLFCKARWGAMRGLWAPGLLLIGCSVLTVATEASRNPVVPAFPFGLWVTSEIRSPAMNILVAEWIHFTLFGIISPTIKLEV